MIRYVFIVLTGCLLPGLLVAGAGRPLIPPPALTVASAFADAERQSYLAGDGQSQLALYLFRPSEADGRTPVVIFFHGSGWIEGSVAQFSALARALSAKGIRAICADYRTARTHGATPIDAVSDGRALLRWLQVNEDDLNIDPERIALAGASSGAHLALSTVIFMEEGTAMKSAKPAALILLSAITDTTEEGYPAGVRLFKGRERELSPLAHLRMGLPPMLLLHGEADSWVPVTSVRRFVKEARTYGIGADLVVFAGRGHAFFNSPDFRPGVRVGDFQTVNFLIEQFLAKLGWITAPELIESDPLDALSP